MTRSPYAERIAALEARAERDREAFAPPDDPPDERRAMRYLREGFGPAVALYVEARTGGGEPVAFHPDEFAALERAMNQWLDLYAACYGTTLDAEFTVREAATLLVGTHNVRDTARVLTRVPPR
ncbi:hypothetical protein ACFQPA_04780 [Halomarina halobia]|uniref:DUF8055 domain-containing protein n=1 Tax=Halomarina halobia TaxID=3033386 RepID=A0ABD6A551_9EURY|nr:hypothetical protein [Halomarina sp. PSR21]